MQCMYVFLWRLDPHNKTKRCLGILQQLQLDELCLSPQAACTTEECSAWGSYSAAQRADSPHFDLQVSEAGIVFGNFFLTRTMPQDYRSYPLLHSHISTMILCDSGELWAGNCRGLRTTPAARTGLRSSRRPSLVWRSWVHSPCRPMASRRSPGFSRQASLLTRSDYMISHMTNYLKMW